MIQNEDDPLYTLLDLFAGPATAALIVLAVLFVAILVGGTYVVVEVLLL